jgi:hypothetical protein
METQCACPNGIDLDEMPRDINPECVKHGIKHVAITKVVPEGPAPGTPMWYERRVRELEKRNESLELVASYAKDVVGFWPQFSFKMIRIMVGKMDALKQALDLLK